MTEVELHEWERVRLARPLFGPAEYVAFEQLPRNAFRVREVAGEVELRAQAHVGRIRLGGLTITVLPKVADRTLIRLFSYAYGLDDLHLTDPTPYPGGALLQDLLAEQLRRRAREILDRGLHRSYRRVAFDLAAPRGRIDIAALARRSPLLQATLPCFDHPRVLDHPLHRALLAGLRLAAGLVAHAGLRAQLRELAARLGDEVAEVPLTRALLNAARRGVHRLVEHYRPALQLIELLYAGSGMEMRPSAPAIVAPGFLFNMNHFFQALVLRLLQDNLSGCEVQSERTLRGLYRWAKPRLPGRSHPRPRPDFTVIKGDERVLLDAKYRDLSSTPLPREMLYQLSVYAMSQGTGGAAAMIYPVPEPRMLLEERLDLFDRLASGPRASVYLRALPLAELAASIEAGPDGEGFRRALAQTLAFGANERATLVPRQ